MNRLMLFMLALVPAGSGGAALPALQILQSSDAVFHTSDTPSMPLVAGETFPDTDGKHINAHGGMIMEKDGIYYWYGENRNTDRGKGQDGVACYTSTDLRHWKNRGIVLPVSETPGAPLERGCIIERPKVVFNLATGKYVMWFHYEEKGKGYGSAYSAVAVADNPLGPFKFLSAGRINPGKWAENMSDTDKSAKYPEGLEWWTPEWRKEISRGMFHARDLDNGQMARDMTLFVDDDGKAYHVYSSESNLTIQIAELDPTFTKHTGRYIRIFPGGHNEAPAIFKHDGRYWMITSGCTGWEPNEARLMRADSIMGEWTQLPNPCRGKTAKRTYESQSTYVFFHDGKYTFMADRWNPADLADSRHLWIPIHFDAEGVPFMSLDQDVHGRVFNERNNDLSWENDLVAFRVYGPDTQKRGEKSYGYDIFTKYPGKGLVLEELYGNQCSHRNWAKVDSLKKIDPKLAKDFENSFTYHLDHGMGMDCYAVGPTLGCGVPAILTGDSIRYPWCYASVNLVDQGPDRFKATLTFQPVVIDGDTIVETRTITLDKGSHLNYSEVTYKGMTKPLTVVAGFPRRGNPDSYTSKSEGIAALADPTQGDSNGKILVGLKMINPVEKVFEKDNHTLVSTTIRPGEKLCYNWGYAWDRTDIKSLEDWVEYLRAYEN